MSARTVTLIAAPAALQPGGYVPKAYSDRMKPSVESARFEVQTLPQGRRVRLIWSCPEPVRELTGDVDRFVDAAALATLRRERAKRQRGEPSELMDLLIAYDWKQSFALSPGAREVL